METTTETRTDASYVYELLLRAVCDEHGYYCDDSNVLALYQDWTRRYSTGRDA